MIDNTVYYKYNDNINTYCTIIKYTYDTKREKGHTNPEILCQLLSNKFYLRLEPT